MQNTIPTSIFACVFIIIYAYNNIIIKSAINAREVHNIARLYTHTYIVPPFTEIQWHAQKGKWVSVDTQIKRWVVHILYYCNCGDIKGDKQ